MESLAKHLTDELFWTQPMAMHRAYELQSSGLVVATLEFETAFGSPRDSPRRWRCLVVQAYGVLPAPRNSAHRWDRR